MDEKQNVVRMRYDESRERWTINHEVYGKRTIQISRIKCVQRGGPDRTILQMSLKVLITKSNFTQVPSMSSLQPPQEIGQDAGKGDAVALYTIQARRPTRRLRVSR